jgi:hypothetical protein
MKARVSHPHEKPHHPHWPLETLLFLFVLVLGLGSVHEPSTWVSLKTGQAILETRALPKTDPFSYGASRVPWSTPSWAGDVALAKLDAAGGPRLVRFVKAVAVAAAFALLLPINHGNPMIAATLLATGACAAWAGFAETPLALGFLFYALFLRLLRPRRRFRWQDAAAGAGLTVLWANLAGAGALLGVWLVGLKVFKTSLRTATRERLGYWTMLAIVLIAFSWNPLGYGLLSHAFADAAPGATVWVTPMVSLYGAFLLAGLASCWFTLQQEFVTTIASATVLALSVVLPGLRPLAVLAACPVIALALGHALHPRQDTWPRVLRWCAVALLLGFVYRREITRTLAPTGGYGAPALAGAASFLSTNGVRGRMFNPPEIGEELIGLTGRPVFADARQGLYPDSFRRDADAWPSLFPELDAAYRFDYAVLPNRRATDDARTVAGTRGWRLAYADDHALVYLKATGADELLVPQTTFRVLTPDRLWPDAMDAALSRPASAAKALSELDRWTLQAPDSVQALLWKAYALHRLKMGDKAARLLELASERRALRWDPELQAQQAFVAEALGRTERARELYRRAERGARRLGRPALTAAVRDRLARLDAAGR